MADVKPAAPSGGVRVTHDVDRAAVGQQVVEFGAIGQFVDPPKVDEKQATRIGSRGIEAIEVHRLASVVGAHPHKVALVTYDVDQFKLLEHRGDRRKTLADLRTRLDRYAQWWRIVENEAHERMPDRPFGKIGDVEVESGQVRQFQLTLLVAHREIVSGTIVEVADTGQVHAVAIDHSSRHDCDLRTPVAIVRGTDGDPPCNHAEKQHNRHHGHAPPKRKPDGPDRERSKGCRQGQTHGRLRSRMTTSSSNHCESKRMRSGDLGAFNWQ
jgi:hypothetical protein